MPSCTEPTRGECGSARAFLSDTDASAAVEFLILLPVYVLLLAGAWATGNFLEARQGVVMATRFRAWDRDARTPFPNPALTEQLFTRHQRFMNAGAGGAGFVAALPPSRTPKPLFLVAGFATGDPTATEEGLPTPNDDVALAARLLNNGGTPLLDRSEFVGQFVYRSTYPAITYTLTSRAVTLLPSERRRPVHHAGEQSHPIVLFPTAASFDPAAGENRYLSPVATDVAPLGNGLPAAIAPPPWPARGPKDRRPGLWDRGYRLGGDVAKEWNFFNANVK